MLHILKRVFTDDERRAFDLPISEAAFPVPFAHGPEFNAPVHGVWNIVHTGMLVPEAHQIYVCAANCMRGVVLTAAEMGASDRFHMVLLEERDLLLGTVEKTTVEGVAAILDELRARGELAPCVLVFTVCTHRFIGCDLDFVYRSLEARYPNVRFLRCYMEPITQKEGLSPDQRLRRTMLDPLEGASPVPRTMAHLGGDFALDADADLRRMLEASGWELLEPPGCARYAEYVALGRASAVCSVYPHAAYGAKACAERLGRPFFHLPLVFSYEAIEEEERGLCDALGLEPLDAAAERMACDDALEQARVAVGSAEVAIDQTVCPRPLGLARLLVEHGMRVERVYLDAVAPEEREDFDWLVANQPQLRLVSCMRPEARVLLRGGKGPVVALGQMAAWRENTGHFVNIVEGAGLWGFSGIRSLARLTAEAARDEKDTRDLVPRKGWGCASCL